MKTRQNAIGVVVFEPNSDLLNKLCLSVEQVWGKFEVLPRQTAKQLCTAALHIDIGLIVVRASVQRSSQLVQEVLTNLCAKGTQILVIQDTGFPVSEKSSVSFKDIHFIHNKLGDEEFVSILRLCLVRHCMRETLDTD